MCYRPITYPSVENRPCHARMLLATSVRSCSTCSLRVCCRCLSVCVQFVLFVLCTAAYVQQFRRLPKHRQAVSYSGRSVLDDSVTVEECARRCLLSTDRPCHGFNYKPQAHYRPCALLHATSDGGGGAGLPVVYADDTDYYQRQPGWSLIQGVPEKPHRV